MSDLQPTLLSVKYKLGRGLDDGILTRTEYIRTLSLVGKAWENGNEKAYRKLLEYMERKGTLHYQEPVKEEKPLAVSQRQVVKAVMIGGQAVCQNCKRCKACGQIKSVSGKCNHAIHRCKCPFPSRVQGWGKAQCDKDKEAIDKLGTQLALKYAAGEIKAVTRCTRCNQAHTAFEHYTCIRKWLDGMDRACNTKLFMLAKLAQDREAESKGTAYDSGEVILL